MKLKFPEAKDMRMYKLIEMAKSNDSFRDMILYKKDLTELWINDVKRKLSGKNPDHIIITIIGDTGSGKSLTGITIGKKYIDPDMWVDNIRFTGEQVIETCKKLRRNSLVILDEQMLSVGVGSVRESLELKNLEEITRKNKLSFMFISPTPREHLTAHYHLELFWKDEKKMENWLAIVTKKDKYLGYIRIKVDPEDPLWKEYDKDDGVKNKFIEQYLERKVSRLDYEKMAKKIIDDDRIKTLMMRNGKVNHDEMIYIIGRHYPSITSTERKELMTELKITNPELFKKGAIR